MFGTPFTSCSIGVPSVSAMTSASAPGYWAVTSIVGGAMVGYCAIGRPRSVTAPAITMTIETTDAKIGR